MELLSFGTLTFYSYNLAAIGLISIVSKTLAIYKEHGVPRKSWKKESDRKVVLGKVRIILYISKTIVIH